MIISVSDMEWINNVQTAASMQVDIGFLPQMEIEMVSSSGKSADLKKTVQGIKWTKEISETLARRNLEVKMYPFKQVKILFCVENKYSCITPIILFHKSVKCGYFKIH